jgi:UDP-2,3-diacylglucosamine hydrolase
MQSLDAVFISDLHLHPQDSVITNRFDQFIAWAATHTKKVYILGDFFHVWPGDDALDDWSRSIARRLAWLTQQKVAVFFMAGNRDFLLGKRFARLAGITQLKEPTVITLGNDRILLVHGDRYCTRDTGHQWLRLLTRNRWFPALFSCLSYSIRGKLVQSVRKHSQSSRKTNRNQSADWMDVVPKTMLRHMKQFQVQTVVHGHTHKPGLTILNEEMPFRQYVLSDWDDNPFLLCYHESEGFYFDRLGDCDGQEK